MESNEISTDGAWVASVNYGVDGVYVVTLADREGETIKESTVRTRSAACALAGRWAKKYLVRVENNTSPDDCY